MVKVRADLETRSHVLETVNLFRAKVVDVAPGHGHHQATGNRGKLDALLKVLRTVRYQGTGWFRNGRCGSWVAVDQRPESAQCRVSPRSRIPRRTRR